MVCPAFRDPKNGLSCFWTNINTINLSHVFLVYTRLLEQHVVLCSLCYRSARNKHAWNDVSEFKCLKI